MNQKFNLKQRVVALCMAAMMCCSLFPVGALRRLRSPMQMVRLSWCRTTKTSHRMHRKMMKAIQTQVKIRPRTAKLLWLPKARRGCAGGDIHRLHLRRRCFVHRLTGYADWFLYGSQGLPVATGETKIGISAWPNDQLEEGADSYLSADTLNSDDLTMMAPLLEGTDYAVAPILAQVEYPADGSSLDVVLPNEVTVLDFYGVPADETTRSSLVHSEYSETSAAVMGLYVQADADFSAQLVYTAPDGSTLTKALHVVIDRSRTMAAPFAETTDVAAYAERPTPAVTSGKITKVEKVNGTWLIWFNGEEAYCCTHGANGQPKGCPPYTYTNTSLVSADQCIPGDHYGNQYRIWAVWTSFLWTCCPIRPSLFPQKILKESLFWIFAARFTMIPRCG